MNKYRHYYILVIVTTLLSLLSACSQFGTTSFQSAGVTQQRYPETADHYLQLASNAPQEQEQTYKLKAVGRLIQDGMQQRARQLLANVDSRRLTPLQTNEKQLLSSHLALLRNQPRTALTHLSRVKDSEQMPQTNQVDYHQLLAKAYARSGNVLDSTQQRIKLEPLLTNPMAQQQNHRQIWNSLQRLSNNTLQSMSIEQGSGELAGWLSLTYIAKQYSSDPKQLVQALSQWQQQYPQHPGNSMLPASINHAAQALPPAAQQIALLLPLHGRLEGPGKAIRDGFMAAYYQAAKQNKHLTIRVYDTTQSQNMKSLYQQAVSNGADLVIGPLNKENAQQLADSAKFSVPTLLLNYVNDRAPATNLYQFGLSPQDEARQAANKAWRDGHRDAIVIAPEGDWGQSIATAFAQRWQQLGGKVVAKFPYQGKQDLAASIKQLMNVDQSNSREQHLQSVLAKKVKFIPRRRQDADMIFLAAVPNNARQIKPMLSFYYASNIPIYATSLIYSGIPSARTDRDLNGIIFCDMPWVFKNGGQVQKNHQTLARLWPQQLNRYTRLYAFGMDAFKLSNQLGRMTLLPEFGLASATGTLYLNPQRKILRELQWAQIKAGTPHLLERRHWA